jgi:hypothetical protein
VHHEKHPWVNCNVRGRGQWRKSADSPKLEKALKAFDKYGIYGLAALGPFFLGTQFAAVAAVSAGVKPARASILIIVSTVVWAAVIAIVMVAFDVKF